MLEKTQEQRTLPALYHRTWGKPDGPWVTFIPGIGNDHSFWQAQADALSQSHRVLVFDPWGHGLSPEPPSPCSFDTVLAGIRQLWASLGIRRSHVVGLGFGGSVALALAARAPDAVDKAVACCCRTRQPDDRREFWRKRIQAAMRDMPALADVTVDRWLSEAFRAARPDVDERLRAMIKRTTPAGYQAYVQAFVDMDLDADVPRIARPVLLIAAEHDHGGGPVPDMRALAQRLPDARLFIVEDSGHICNHEQPDVVTAQIEAFLGDTA